MTNTNKPRPTKADYIKRKDIISQYGELSDEHINILNSFDWSTQVFMEDDKYGLKSALGIVILDADYEEFQMLSSTEFITGDRVVAKQNDKWGVLVIDGPGSWLIEPEYDYIGYPNNLTHVKKGNEWGVLDIEKKDFLLPLGSGKIEAHSGFMFTNGIGVYEKDGKYGVIVDDGTYTDPIFDKVDDEPFGLVKVRLNKIWGYISKNRQFTENKDEVSATFRYKG